MAQVLWAINLVFRVCEIDFILTMDKNIIEAAFKRSSLNQDEDSVDKFIRKTIQLPLSLPDPADEEWNSFLEKELGYEPKIKSTQYYTIDSSPNDEQGM